MSCVMIKYGVHKTIFCKYVTCITRFFVIMKMELVYITEYYVVIMTYMYYAMKTNHYLVSTTYYCKDTVRY